MIFTDSLIILDTTESMGGTEYTVDVVVRMDTDEYRLSVLEVTAVIGDTPVTATLNLAASQFLF